MYVFRDINQNVILCFTSFSKRIDGKSLIKIGFSSFIQTFINILNLHHES